MTEDGRSSTGFEEGEVAAISYFGFLGVLLLIIEKKSDFVRFHALQSTLGFSFLAVFWLCVKWIPALQFLWWAPGLAALAFALFMMYRAYHGEEYKFPLIGNMAFNAIYDTESGPEDLLAATGDKPSSSNDPEGGSAK